MILNVFIKKKKKKWSLFQLKCSWRIGHSGTALNFHNWPNIKILLQQQHVACVGNRKMATWRFLLYANFAGITLWSLPHWLMGNLLLPRRLEVVTVTWCNSHHVHYQSHCQMLQASQTHLFILFCNFIFWTFKRPAFPYTSAYLDQYLDQYLDMQSDYYGILWSHKCFTC